jgi:hypothetical protein
MFYYLSASRQQMLDKTLVLANAVAKTTFRQDLGEATRIVFYFLSQPVDEDATRQYAHPLLHEVSLQVSASGVSVFGSDRERQATSRVMEAHMKRFFELTFRPFFILTGLGTALASLDAFWPRWTVETIQKIPFVQDYTIILQHWGIMVGLMGIFMVVAAFSVEWRKPILIYSAFEKTFMVYLVLANGSHPYAQGFKLPGAMDATVVLYTIAYFAVYGFTAHEQRRPRAEVRNTPKPAL